MKKILIKSALYVVAAVALYNFKYNAWAYLLMIISVYMSLKSWEPLVTRIINKF